MKILFNWCDSFASNQEWRNDEEIISLEITQKEGCFASAKVSLPNKKIPKKYARIGVEQNGKIETLFCGKIISFPLSFDNSLMRIELLSESDDYREQLKNFSDSCRRNYKEWNFDKTRDCPIAFDDLFFPENEKNNPTVFLEGDSKIFYWNAKNGKLSLSDINFGEKNFEISKKDVLKGSTKIRLSREPYGKINLRISANWIQKVHGFVDVFPIIARKFKYNRISSFTDISSGFKNVSQEGYSLLYKKINEVNPNEGNSLGNFPTVSSPIKIQKNGEEKFANFHRFYYSGKFVLGWEYHQKRIETVEVALVDKKYTREKDVSINLSSIQLSKDYPYWRPRVNYLLSDKVIFSGYVYECVKAHRSNFDFEKDNWRSLKKVPDALRDDSLSSFFATDRGKFCVRYALKKAAALMNYSRRYVTISFCVDANKFWPITVNDQITFTDFFNKNVTAKVIQTNLRLTGDSRLMKITVGYSPKISSDIFSKNYQFEIEKNSSQVEMEDVVTDVIVENSPEEQDTLLSAEQFSSFAEAKSFLKNHATKIKVSLHPLSTKREISTVVKLPDLEV